MFCNYHNIIKIITISKYCFLYLCICMLLIFLYAAKGSLGSVKIKTKLASGDHGACTLKTGFAELQMTCTHSGRLCSSFELQIMQFVR